MNRREFLTRGATAAAVIGGGGWMLGRTYGDPGRLATRPHKPTRTLSPGEQSSPKTERGARFCSCRRPTTRRAAPFFLALHGATGSGDSMLRGSRAAAEAHGVVMLSPSSRDYTWDAIRGSYGDDFRGRSIV